MAMIGKTGVATEVFEIQVNWKIWQFIAICDSGTKQTDYNHLSSFESQPVSNFVDKTIILKQAAAILKKDANTFFEEISGVSRPPAINKLGKDSKRPPEIILNFYYVISIESSFHSAVSNSINLLLMSFSEDLLFFQFAMIYLEPSPTNPPSQDLAMKYLLYPILI